MRKTAPAAALVLLTLATLASAQTPSPQVLVWNSEQSQSLDAFDKAAARAQSLGATHMVITDNLPRCLPDGLDGEVNLDAIAVLPVFQWLAKEAGIAEAEMLRTFNCGIGMVAVADEKDADAVIAAFGGGARIGKLVAGSGEAKTVYRGTLKL